MRRAKKLAVLILSSLVVPAPLVRRSGLAKLARVTGLSAAGSRVGLDRLIERAVVARGPSSAGFRAWHGAGVDAAGRPAGTTSSVPAAIAIAQAAIRHGRYEEAIRWLEGLLDEHGPGLGPRVYKVLAHAQRKAGDAQGARSTLRTALEHHAFDERLLLALVEEHTMAQQWADAFACWQQMPRRPREGLSRWGYVRIARMLRIQERYEDAHAVATEGLRKHPEHAPLQGEHRRIRVHLTDWSKSLVPLPGSEAPDLEPAGAVDDLGFLQGAMTSPISGFVDAEGGAGQKVALQVNGVDVVSTSPQAAEAGPGSAGHPFVLSCQDLLEYLGDGDRLTFSVGGRPLSMPALGLACEVRAGHPSRFAQLKGKLDEGFVFTKFGRLRAGHSAERKQSTLRLYDDINTVIGKVTGRPGFPFYGNLLGAVREHDFIEHDVGGFDMAYLSEHTTPEAVKAEFVEICRALLEAGLHLKLEPWSAMTRRDFGDPVFVDVSFAWLTETGALHISFGWRHEPVRDRQAFLDFRECALHDTVVRVPGNAEDVLVQLYGQGWRVPDQGFTPSAPLQREERYLLSYAELEEIRALAPQQVRIAPSSPEGAASQQ